MRKTIQIITTLFASLMLAVTAFAAPANAVFFAAEDKPGTPNINDLQAASSQYQARDGFSMVGASGMWTYRVLNLPVESEGVPADLGNGTCPGPMIYTDNTMEQMEYVAELGECGGWDRYGWLKEGDVVRLSGKLTGNYIVKDVVALGAPGNAKLNFTDTPDVVLMVNNSSAQNEMHMFGLIDYTKRLPTVSKS